MTRTQESYRTTGHRTQEERISSPWPQLHRRDADFARPLLVRLGGGHALLGLPEAGSVDDVGDPRVDRRPEVDVRALVRPGEQSRLLLRSFGRLLIAPPLLAGRHAATRRTHAAPRAPYRVHILRQQAGHR